MVWATHHGFRCEIERMVSHRFAFKKMERITTGNYLNLFSIPYYARKAVLGHLLGNLRSPATIW